MICENGKTVGNARNSLRRLLQSNPTACTTSRSANCLHYGGKSQSNLGSQKNKLKIFLLKDENLNPCIGSKVSAFCDRAFPILKKRSSFLASLFVYHDSNTAFQYYNFDFEPLPLPVQKKAINIGHSPWLKLAASSNYQPLCQNTAL